MGQTSTDTYGSLPLKQTQLELTARSEETYGFAFPTGKKRGSGDYNRQSGLTLLRNNLEQLILTEKGERVMFPQFGMSLRRFIFQPLTEELFTNIKYEITASISQFMPSLDILKLRVTEADNINVEGGMGLNIALSLSARELNNTVFTVGVQIK